MLVGAGSLGAAVAMVGLDGDYYSEGAKGVIRLTQVHPRDLPVSCSGGQRTLCDRGGGGWVNARCSWACHT